MPPATASRRKGPEAVHWLLKGLLPLEVCTRCACPQITVWQCLICVTCLLPTLVFFLFAALSFNQTTTGSEKKAHWIIASSFRHFLTWKMMKWRVELDGLWVFLMFKYSPELSHYPLQFVKYGIVSILCLIIWKAQVNIGYSWWLMMLSCVLRKLS